MALTFTVSYTFSPNTTIASAQVNTNTSDVSNVFNGLEALTKTLAKLKVDVDPATALEVATKQYVDHYSTYRRPVLVYNSATVVNVESGLDGTSGDVVIQFPDGNKRTDSTTSRVQCNLSQNAVLSGTAVSGLRTGSLTNNTWYAFYAVKTSDNSSNFVIVADTVLPLQANFTTLNSNFGANSWIYLGVLPNGDHSGAATNIPQFVMAGNRVVFYNACTGASSGSPAPGVRLATTAGATSLTWTYAAGTALGSNQVPNNLVLGDFAVGASANTTLSIGNSAGNNNLLFLGLGNSLYVVPVYNAPLINGIKSVPSGSVAQDIYFMGYVDSVLGVGANALL
jgi:hypothetical protein